MYEAKHLNKIIKITTETANFERRYMATKLVVKVYVLDFVFSDNEIKWKKRKK